MQGKKLGDCSLQGDTEELQHWGQSTIQSSEIHHVLVEKTLTWMSAWQHQPADQWSLVDHHGNRSKALFVLSSGPELWFCQAAPVLLLCFQSYRQRGEKKNHKERKKKGRVNWGPVAKPLHQNWLVSMWKKRGKWITGLFLFWVFPKLHLTLWITLPARRNILLSSQPHTLKN